MPNRNLVDRRRTLTPRDYAVEPCRFGHDPDVTFRTPPGGDDTSRHVAEVIHRLVVSVRRQRINGSQVAARWGMSRQTWSDVLNGRHWPSMTGVAAIVAALTGHAHRNNNR